MRLRKRWLLLATYLVLLAASHLLRVTRPDPGPAEGVQTLEVAVVDGEGRRSSDQVSMAYREWGDAVATGPPVVLLHGSPGSSGELAAFGATLGRSRRVIAPDLPGFGDSSERVPSYSILAHAEYVRRLLDNAGVERFDVLGFSMGGGVAIHLAALEPERTRSLTLLSSIGVQELELMGSYELNHAVHALQLGGLWLVHQGVPHFGVLDDAMLSVPYARNFYDTDQRPLRQILSRLELPTLILHSEVDPLVPIEAAREHHRIVPQSRLVIHHGSHFTVFTEPQQLVAPVSEFLAAVDAGTAPRRTQATAERSAAAAEPYDPSGREPVAGFSLVVLVLLLAAATLVSEDLTCIAAGLLVAQGTIGFFPAVLGCFIGIVIGDIGLYWAGRAVGSRVLTIPPFSWVLTEARLAESAAWFERRGALVILISRFVPGTRLATYLSSGLLKVGFLRFTFYFVLASALWTPMLVGLSALVGGKIFDYFATFQRGALLGLIASVLIVWGVLKIAPLLFTWRGRRLMIGFAKRWAHWEFWPWWVLYIPVAAWVAWLGLRFRGPTLFTLANPGIECGGFAGESKAALLRQIPDDVAPRWGLLPGPASAPERREHLDSFLSCSGIELPIVLKPDSGERGRAVQVIRSRGEAADYLERHSGPTLVQDYVPGVEFGLFYIRHPEDESGRVTSIAAKILPRLTGDGHSTLEHLILADDRTVCQAPYFLASLAGFLERVPADGEEISLGELGTHSRGAMFLDANHLRTAELEAVIDRIARTVDGFFFGRFDIRVPSEEHLRRGEGIQILELNGVTSEEAHMYDPKHGVLYAWKTLGSQWRTAFEIGRVHRASGRRPDGVADLARTVWRYRRVKSS